MPQKLKDICWLSLVLIMRGNLWASIRLRFELMKALSSESHHNPLNQPLLQTTMALIARCFKTQHYVGNKFSKPHCEKRRAHCGIRQAKFRQHRRSFSKSKMLVCKPQNESGGFFSSSFYSKWQVSHSKLEYNCKPWLTRTKLIIRRTLMLNETRSCSVDGTEIL